MMIFLLTSERCRQCQVIAVKICPFVVCLGGEGMDDTDFIAGELVMLNDEAKCGDEEEMKGPFVATRKLL